MKIHIAIIALFSLFFSACIHKQNRSVPSTQKENVRLKYAEGFILENTPHYTMVTVTNPWKEGEIYDKYYLVKETSVNVPEDGKKIKIPIENLAVNSATYLEFIRLLGETGRITGVCNTNYIYSPLILQRVKEGKIKDIGDAFNLDIENLLFLHPQAIMTSAYNAKDENSKKLEQTGIPVLYNIEWQEKKLLGRTEWIKFIAAFFDKQTLADSLFNEIEKRYNEVKTKIAVSSPAIVPVVMTGQDFRGTWTIPAGNSFNAELFRNAGGIYFYANDTVSGSIASNIENALINFRNATVWVGVQAQTLKELGEIDPKYKLFPPYRTGNVYNYNKRVNQSGGNDYWEGAVAHPDLLLADMAKAFHPEIFPEYKMTYMQKLK